MLKKNFLLAFIFVSLFCVSVGYGVDFFTGVEYPKSEYDYSFTERMAAEEIGYSQYSGLSPYEYIKLVEMEEIAHSEIEEEEQDGEEDELEYGLSGAEDSELVMEPDIVEPSVQSTVQSTQGEVVTDAVETVALAPVVPSPVSEKTGNAVVAYNSKPVKAQTPTSSSGYCSLTHPKIAAGQTVPFGSPVLDSDVPGTSNGNFCSYYDCARRRPHAGVDIGCRKEYFRKPIFATADGTVDRISRVKKGKSAGNAIRIDHGGGWKTYYMHLDEMLVNRGDRVKAGCLIGYMGYTGGNADRPSAGMGIGLTHLHYQIHYKGHETRVRAPNGQYIDIKPGKRTYPSCEKSSSKVKWNDTINPREFITYKW